MLHNEIKRLAEAIGNECQDTAEDAGRLVAAVEAVEAYPSPDDWMEHVEGETDELVSALDILAGRCAEVRDALDAAKRGVAA